MAFNSIEYLYFLIVVVAAYRLLPFKLGLIGLLGASYYFYASWNHKYLLLIIASTLIDYLCAIAIEKNTKTNRLFLAVSLLSNLGILFVFKYFGFFTEIANQIANSLGGSLSLTAINVILPVGISFYTFQTMSYTIDVYHRKIPAEKNIIRFALYVSFFPQLVAGPIERASSILPQFFKKCHPNYEDYLSGIERISWGLFKKVVIADRLALYVNYVFTQPDQFSNGALAMAGIFSSIMLYADFSAYVDIALGSAKCLGIKLSPNFKFPFFCTSMPQFWRHWHISLHNWFFDYIYLPLGGSKVGKLKFVLNIFIIFFLSGLWHGASLNFLLWGLLHFTFIAIHLFLSRYFKITLPMLIGIILVNFQWILSMYLFFIPDLQSSLYIFNSFITQSWAPQRDLFGPNHVTGFLLNLFFTVFLLTAEALHIKKPWQSRCKSTSPSLKYGFYYLIIFSIFIFGIETNNPFIYFQF